MARLWLLHPATQAGAGNHHDQDEPYAVCGPVGPYQDQVGNGFRMRTQAARAWLAMLPCAAPVSPSCGALRGPQRCKCQMNDDHKRRRRLITGPVAWLESRHWVSTRQGARRIVCKQPGKKNHETTAPHWPRKEQPGHCKADVLLLHCEGSFQVLLRVQEALLQPRPAYRALIAALLCAPCPALV